MAVAFDSVLAPPTTSVTSTPIARTHTASASGVANGYIVVVGHARSPTATGSCTVNGSAAEELGHVTGSASACFVWGFALGTVAANATIAISVANTALQGFRIGSVLFSGVDQTTPHGTGASDNSGTTSPQTTTAVTSAAGSVVVSAYTISAATSPTAARAAGTGTIASRWSSSGGSGGSAMGEGCCTLVETAAETVQVAWTASTTSHEMFTVPVLAVSAVSPSLPPNAARHRSPVTRFTQPARGSF